MSRLTTRWHRVPKGISFLLIPLAAMTWAFDQSKTMWTGHDPAAPGYKYQIGIIYDCNYFYLMQLHRSGSWYFRAGSLNRS